MTSRATTFLDRYRPREEWFQHDPYGIHGLGHIARVLVWADRLTAAANGDGEHVDDEVVRWAAACHDLGRHDDGRDPEHGERSALWLAENAGLVASSLGPRRLALVDYCCRWHVPRDDSIPRMTPELRCLKDADGLDRVRLGDLKVELLRSEQARGLVAEAEDLFRATSPLDRHDPWGQVREAALARGLWR